MSGLIHLCIPDAVRAHRTYHIRPGARIVVLLRCGVRMEYSQPRPGVLMETCLRCGAFTQDLAYSVPRMARARHRDGCPALKVLAAGTDG
jgi:hypothetical protein